MAGRATPREEELPVSTSHVLLLPPAAGAGSTGEMRAASRTPRALLPGSGTDDEDAKEEEEDEGAAASLVPVAPWPVGSGRRPPAAPVRGCSRGSWRGTNRIGAEDAGTAASAAATDAGRVRGPAAAREGCCCCCCCVRGGPTTAPESRGGLARGGTAAEGHSGAALSAAPGREEW
jgi:hypothetical protein